MFRTIAPQLHVSAVVVNGSMGAFEGYPNDALLAAYARDGAYGKAIVDIISSGFDEGGGTFIDIGANIGLVTVPVAANQKVDCHAFEPEPRNYCALMANVRRSGRSANVKGYNAALHDAEMTQVLQLSHDNFGDHRIISVTADSPAASVSVPAVPLDRALERSVLRQPLVIKMDAQGSEVSIIRGGGRVFSQARMVISEFFPHLLRSAGSDPSDFIEFCGQFATGEVIGAPTGRIPVDELMRSLCRFVETSGDGEELDLVLRR